MDVAIKRTKVRKRLAGEPKVRWWNLTTENAVKLSEKIMADGDWRRLEDVDKMWEALAGCIRESAKDVLGVSRGGGSRLERAWWWTNEVKEKVEVKQDAYAALNECSTEEEREILMSKYKDAIKVGKKAVALAKINAFERLYQKLETKEGEKAIFKLARARENKTRDLGSIRCVKSEDGKVLTEDSEIRERLRSYFCKLFNDKVIDHALNMGRGGEEGQPRFVLRSSISEEKIRDALKKMKNGKAVGPDSIPVEIWKCLGEQGLGWLTDLFNMIFRAAKMPREWKTSTIIPLYKNKRDI